MNCFPELIKAQMAGKRKADEELEEVCLPADPLAPTGLDMRNHGHFLSVTHGLPADGA
jgi:hypothetical protein